MKNGRPTLYNENMHALICERVATSTLGLKKLCEKHDDMPHVDSVNLWRYQHPNFSALYAQAKLVQADLLAEECLDIADDNSRDTKVNFDGEEVCNTEFIARSRLRIDTRKWLASKLLPKQYGLIAEDRKSISESIVDRLIDKLVE